MALFSNSCQKLFLTFFSHIIILGKHFFSFACVDVNLHSERENIDSLSSIHSFLPALENVLIILAMTSSVGFDTEYNVGVVFSPFCVLLCFFFNLKPITTFRSKTTATNVTKGQESLKGIQIPIVRR